VFSGQAPSSSHDYFERHCDCTHLQATAKSASLAANPPGRESRNRIGGSRTIVEEQSEARDATKSHRSGTWHRRLQLKEASVP
jgi:hypothetical protein